MRNVFVASLFGAIASALVIGAMAFAEQPAPAQTPPPPKVAIVDLQVALNNVEAGKRAIAAIEGVVKSKEAELTEKKDRITRLSNTLNDSRPLLAQEVITQKEQELASAYLDYQQFAYEAQVQTAEMESKMRGEVLEKLTDTVKGLAKERGFDLVIEAGSVVYSRDAYDLSTALILAHDRR